MGILDFLSNVTSHRYIFDDRKLVLPSLLQYVAQRVMDPAYQELLLECCFEFPLIVFSIVTLRCVVANYRKKANGFGTDFFLFYIAQSSVDLTDYFVVSQENKLEVPGQSKQHT